MKKQMIAWMKQHRNEHVDQTCNEVNYTTLAEAACDAFKQWDRLDDDQDPIWDWVLDACQ